MTARSAVGLPAREPGDASSRLLQARLQLPQLREGGSSSLHAATPKPCIAKPSHSGDPGRGSG